MNKKMKWILKIISMILVLIVELMVLTDFWIGDYFVKQWTPIRAYFILTLIILVISIFDKVVLTLVDLFKSIISKKHRLERIKEINEEIQVETKWYKILGKIFHLIIFENTWLVVLVFCLHSTEYLINGYYLLNGKVEAVGLYSLLMRVVEYPIVILTFVYNLFKNKTKYAKLLKNLKK